MKLVQIWVEPDIRDRVNQAKRGTERQNEVVKRAMDALDIDPEDLTQEAKATRKELNDR